MMLVFQIAAGVFLGIIISRHPKQAVRWISIAAFWAVIIAAICAATFAAYSYWDRLWPIVVAIVFICILLAAPLYFFGYPDLAVFEGLQPSRFQ
ncbi:hypothetical protein [Hydrocarboniphaga effusa]|uniref:hypothetical protein n=1 Tax=Hydrocarboniphaga effusa TaxID=243629 RepID=UPI00398BE046